jgi:hypothetical protein
MHNDPLPAPSPELKLSKEDMLELEVSFLKIQNFKMQGEKLVADAKKCNELILEEHERLKAKRAGFSAKYGVDISKCHIEADGTIKPGVKSIPGIPGM